MGAQDGEAALQALLRVSRLLAERIGVGPTPVPAPVSQTERGFVGEAEALAAGAAKAWRRQKATGAVPTGANSIIEALSLLQNQSCTAQPRDFCGALIFPKGQQEARV